MTNTTTIKRLKILIVPSLIVMAFMAISAISSPDATVDCEKEMTSMYNSIKQLKTLKYNLVASERIEDKYSKASSLVKLNISPFKAYYKDLKKGIEALLVEGKEDNEAIVNPNGFPYFNLHLDPKGKLMHKDQHQTMDRLGFSYIGNVLYHSLAKFDDAYKKYVSYKGDTTCDGNACYKIQIDFPDFHYYDYLVGKGETVLSIAGKFYLNDYLVLSTNKLSSYEDQLKEGQIISIPNGYAKCTIIAIRKDVNLPVYAKVYDNKGLLEEYQFNNLKVNPTFQDAEFTENYSDYHF